jgi:hypothetical protein
VATDGYWKLTHLVTGRDWRERTGPTVRAYYAAFTPDGTRVIIGGDTYVAYLDVATGRELWRAEGRFNSNYFRASLAGSPDGRLVAAGGEAGQSEKDGGCVRLYDAADGRERAKLPTPHFRISATAFSPDTRFLLAASTPYQPLGNVTADAANRAFPVSLWEVATGSEVCRFHGHEGAVGGLAFAPDGRTFYSASEDGTVLHWDAFGLRDVAVAGPGEGEALWNDLGGGDAAKAYRSVVRLAASPREACVVLGQHLRPAQAVPPGRLAELIRDLDSDRYAAREAAQRALGDLGEQAGGVLRTALQRRPPLEVRRRVEALLEERRARPYPPGEVQRARAVQVLEWVGTAEAQRLLETLAQGTAAVLHVREARSALKRLDARANGP